MQFLLYEFITGGGWFLVEPQQPPQGSLLKEGLAMVLAAAEDFAALAGAEVTLFWDARLALTDDLRRLANCRLVPISSQHEHAEQLAKVAAGADDTMLIAPEFDGHLLRLSQLVVEVGGRLVSPSPDFVELATDKHTTAAWLAQRGVAMPRGMAIATGAALPPDFTYPAVLKPRDGAGSQDVKLLPQWPGDSWRATANSRLEMFVPGRAASVAALCGPHGNVLLPSCWQQLSDDGNFTYLGGATPLPIELAERARRLAQRALAALPPARGYVGIDIVLGEEETSDTVIEVNPRLTTSYVGLRRLVRENLAAALLQTAAGKPPVLSLRPGRVEFTADGHVAYFEQHE